MSGRPGGVAAAVAALANLESSLGKPSRYVVAFSGGLDSTVLLDAMLEHRPRSAPLLAVHVNHGLQADAPKFAAFCEDFSRARGVDLRVLEVDVDTTSGLGTEAAAREARYDALSSNLEPGDWLLSAHHANDQVETLLLNMLRGSGPDGLAAMPVSRPLGPGWLVRPFLGLDRSALESWTRGRQIAWMDDPSNALTDYDRNYLRHEVLPVLEKRWPEAVRRLLASVERAQDARELLQALGRADVETLGGNAVRLELREFVALSAARQRNVIRVATRILGLPAPPRESLASVLQDLVPARPDAVPLVAWPGAEARRYRDRLYLMSPLAPKPGQALRLARGGIELPAGHGRLAIDVSASEGLAPELLSEPAQLEVRWRTGGESLRLEADGPTRKLKTLLQERGVVPWMRDRVPLIYAGDELVAVADLFVSAAFSARPGAAIRWHDHPPLY